MSRFRQAMEDLYESVDFFIRIVEGKGRAHRALEAEMALGWKCAVVPGSYGDSMIVQVSCNILNRYFRDYK